MPEVARRSTAADRRARRVRPDAVWGEEVVSYVVLRPGECFAPDDLMRYCAAQLPAFKAPKQILLREVLPKSARGKLDRKALVAEWRRGGP